MRTENMGFEFSLQGLLRVRESFEKKEEQKLALAIGELKCLNTMLERVREQLTSTADRLSSLLARGTTGANLHLLCFEKVLLERREQALAESVSAALKEVQDQQTRFREAKQKRKILLDLREKQFTLFLLTEGRKDQQKLDDAYLLRRTSNHTGKSVA
jgi:flagellar export protein FliJ